jgi:HNH endonuclease
MTELVELQHWRCPWCRDYLPDSPRGTAIDHIIPRVYGGPHRRWNLQLLHQECNSAKGKKITAEALELADAHGVTISMNIGQYRAAVRRRAATYAVRATRQLGGEARDRALAAARNLTVFFPERRVHAVIRAAAEGNLARGGDERVPHIGGQEDRQAGSSLFQRVFSGASASGGCAPRLGLLECCLAHACAQRF